MSPKVVLFLFATLLLSSSSSVSFGKLPFEKTHLRPSPPRPHHPRPSSSVSFVKFSFGKLPFDPLPSHLRPSPPRPSSSVSFGKFSLGKLPFEKTHIRPSPPQPSHPQPSSSVSFVKFSFGKLPFDPLPSHLRPSPPRPSSSVSFGKLPFEKTHLRPSPPRPSHPRPSSSVSFVKFSFGKLPFDPLPSHLRPSPPRPSSSVSFGKLPFEKTHPLPSPPRPSSSVSAPRLPDKKTNQFRNWLVLTWPIGYCYPRTDCENLHQRRLSKYTEFTIHGLWPVDLNGEGLNIPFGLHKGRDDICDVIDSAGLSADIVTYWPSLMFKYNVDLWMNEWNMHGNCQNSLFPEDYFINTIQVAQYIDLRTTLAEEGIVPSNSRPYLRESYITAITKKTGSQPLLLCNPTPYIDGLPVLGEVVICVDAIAEVFVPCPVQPDYPKLCPPEPIWFLAPVP